MKPEGASLDDSEDKDNGDGDFEDQTERIGGGGTRGNNTLSGRTASAIERAGSLEEGMLADYEGDENSELRRLKTPYNYEET